MAFFSPAFEVFSVGRHLSYQVKVAKEDCALKTTFLYRLGTLLLLFSVLAVFGIGTAAGDTPQTPLPQITFHIEIIKTTAGDVAKSSMPFDYTPFAPAVLGNIPLNPGVAAPQDEGSLATVSGAGAAMFQKYLHSHGKALAKPAIQTADGVPATITISEPIQGPIGGATDSALASTNSLRTQVGITPKINPDGSIDYNLTVALLGGKKQAGTTTLSQETIKIEHQGPAGETFAFGGLATTDSIAAAGVPLLTDGLTSDGGFGAADPKTPVLFVAVTTK